MTKSERLHLINFSFILFFLDNNGKDVQVQMNSCLLLSFLCRHPHETIQTLTVRSYYSPQSVISDGVFEDFFIQENSQKFITRRGGKECDTPGARFFVNLCESLVKVL